MEQDQVYLSIQGGAKVQDGRWGSLIVIPHYTSEIQKGVDMPRGYEKLRDAFKKEGMGDKAAKGKAARIWNAKHKENPVTRKKGK